MIRAVTSQPKDDDATSFRFLRRSCLLRSPPLPNMEQARRKRHAPACANRREKDGTVVDTPSKTVGSGAAKHALTPCHNGGQ